MNDQQLESFLREHRPETEKDPTFILETRRRMAEVEGIKAEVDRTRNTGRGALVAALVAGIAIGTIVTALAFLYPVEPGQVAGSMMYKIRLFLDSYKQYFIPGLATMIVALTLVLSLYRKPAGEI